MLNYKQWSTGTTIQDPAGTGSGFFFKLYPAGTGSVQVKIRPEPEPDPELDPDPKYFKFDVVSLENKLKNFNYYNTLN